MNIRELRIGRGLTQDQLAAASGVKQGYISKWEKGRAYPNARSLLRLAVGLGRPIDDIVAGVDADYEPIRTGHQQAVMEPREPRPDEAAIVAGLIRQLQAFLLLPADVREEMTHYEERDLSPRSSAGSIPVSAAAAGGKPQKRGRGVGRAHEKHDR